MKMCRGEFLTWVLHGEVWSVLRSVRFTLMDILLDPHSRRGWTDRGVDLGNMKNGKFLDHARNQIQILR